MSVEKYNRVFKKIMKPLGFEFERLVKHGERWKHPEKGIFYQMSGTPSGNAWFDDARRQFQKLISSNFDTDELNELLKPLLKKNKVKFNKQGKLRVLRIGGDFETNLIRDLIIPDIDGDDMPIHQELQEFSDGKDDDEMDALYEKVKDISFKVLKKDKRKTKIED
jgi:hypothetical protein